MHGHQVNPRLNQLQGVANTLESPAATGNSASVGFSVTEAAVILIEISSIVSPGISKLKRSL